MAYMTRTLSLILSGVIAVAAAGCASTNGASPVGSLSFGSLTSFGEPSGKLAGTALIGALHGGIIDPNIAARMSAGTRNAALQAEYEALEYKPAGEKVSWGKAGDRFQGEVAASQPYRVGSQNCRQYTHTIVENGVSGTSRGTACREADGRWTPLT